MEEVVFGGLFGGGVYFGGQFLEVLLLSRICIIPQRTSSTTKGWKLALLLQL